MTDKAIRDFVQCQKRLLQLEFDEEQGCQISERSHKTDESPQSVLHHLEVSDVSLGLMGRTVLSLQSMISTSESSYSGLSSKAADTVESSKVKGSLLPSHRLAVGDEVEIISKKSKQQSSSNSKSTSRGGVTGVISAVTDETISIVLHQNKGSAATKEGNSDDSTTDEIDDLWESSPLTVIPKSSIQVHRKMMQALDDLSTFGVEHEIAGSIVQAVFGEPILGSDLNVKPPAEIIPFNPDLDQSQRSAIEFVLSNEYPIALIHGPPGTIYSFFDPIVF